MNNHDSCRHCLATVSLRRQKSKTTAAQETKGHEEKERKEKKRKGLTGISRARSTKVRQQRPRDEPSVCRQQRRETQTGDKGARRQDGMSRVGRGLDGMLIMSRLKLDSMWFHPSISIVATVQPWRCLALLVSSGHGRASSTSSTRH